MNNLDVVVIGGGIHGCAAAANAAARGLSVLLVEKDDFASKTSSASTKLIHGGLRYLEQADFHLVKQSLTARAALLKQAPHLVHPLPFVLPHNYRPAWKIRLGLFLYDVLAGQQPLPRSCSISRKSRPELFDPLQPTLAQAALYFDAQTDDARLTIENALQAKHFAAQLRPRTTLTAAHYCDQHWQLTLTPQQGATYTVQAQAIINTSGAWVNDIHDLLQLPHPHEMTWVKGSHILLPALYPGEHAYLLQHPDQRVIFCIPYHGLSLVGTTDQNLQGDPDEVQMDAKEADYLCQILKHYFKPPLQGQDILGHYSGVRTLIHNPDRSLSTLKREAAICLAHPSVVSLYGGKLTTHQLTAAALVDALKPVFPKMNTVNLLSHPFPGATAPDNLSYAAFISQLKARYAFLPPKLFNRYLNQYGTRVSILLKNCTKLSDLGEEVLPQLFAQEIEFLCTEEWAFTAQDILWRRTKLGLQCSTDAERKLEAYLQ